MVGGVAGPAGECRKVVVIDGGPFYDHTGRAGSPFFDVLRQSHQPHGKEQLVFFAKVAAQDARDEWPGIPNNAVKLAENGQVQVMQIAGWHYCPHNLNMAFSVSFDGQTDDGYCLGHSLLEAKKVIRRS